jgi:hypothetical protein
MKVSLGDGKLFVLLKETNPQIATKNAMPNMGGSTLKIICFKLIVGIRNP